MKSLLILPHIKVENANAISGLLYGFPSVTNFLGYVHAISRDLEKHEATSRIKLGGCAIVCHHHQIQAYRAGSGGEYMFSLTRNPLTKEGDTAPFNEEGRVRMEVSIIVECNFTANDFDFGAEDEDPKKFVELVYQLAVVKRLAGGYITDMRPVEYHEVPTDEEKIQSFFRKTLYKMLPGFVLCDKAKFFEKYLSENSSQGALESLLEFCTLKSRAVPSSKEGASSEKVKWEQIPKPCGGWVVPIQTGYRAISPLYEAGKVACARDPNVPFRFVEPIYGLGEWISPHRINDIESTIWRYQSDQNYYVCANEIRKK